MEKDLDGWELISGDGFLDFKEDGERKFFVGKQNSGSLSVYGVEVDVDYFVCRSPNSRKIVDSPWVPNRLVPVPIRLEPRFEMFQDDTLVREITLPPSGAAQKLKSPPGGAMEADPDKFSQVFFKKKENEFVDMKMDSPKSDNRVMFPQIDAAAGKFEDSGEGMEKVCSPRMKNEEDVLTECDKTEEESSLEENKEGFNLLKWSFTGIGAICSFGVAAATICILFFGSQQRNTSHHNSKIQFQIYTDDKRIKLMMEQATKLNGGICATGAHTSYGDYYDGLCTA